MEATQFASVNAAGRNTVTLESWVNACIERQRHCYLLLDSLQAEDSHLRLRVMNVPYASLFDGTREEGLQDIAPLLVEMTGLDESRRRRMMSWLLQLGCAAPCLSGYESPLSLKTLASHLRKFHHVGLSEGQMMMMRWYDTRILPVWLQVLKPPQAKLFTSGLSSLAYLDRFGEVQVVQYDNPPDSSDTPALSDLPLIQLDDDQFGVLVDASEPDQIADMLTNSVPDMASAIPLAERFAFIERHRRAALALKIDSTLERCLYCSLALLYGENFAQEDRWKAGLERVSRKEISLEELVQASDTSNI